MPGELQARLQVLNRVNREVFGDDAVLPGAAEDQIANLVAFAGSSVPGGYLEFLRLTNGFLDLRDADHVVRKSAFWRTYWPGGLVIGSDGGEGKFILDLAYEGADEVAAPVPYFETEDLTLGNDNREWPSFTSFFLDFFTDEYVRTGGE